MATPLGTFDLAAGRLGLFDETASPEGWFDPALLTDPPASGGIAEISGQRAGNRFTAASSVAVSAPADLTVGSLITIVVWSWKSTTNDAFVVGDIAQTAGTATLSAFSLDVNDNVSFGSYLNTAVFSAIVTGAGSCTITVSGMPANAYGGIAFDEFSGNWDSSRVEDTAAATGASAGLSSGDMTSAGAALFVGGCGSYNGSNPTTYTPDSPFTNVYTNTNGATDHTGAGAFAIVASGTTDAVSWNMGTGYNWQAVGVVYKEAAGGGPTNVPLNQATETDTAQAFAKLKQKAFAQVSETDTAQPFTEVKRRAVGLVTETDTAQAFGRVKQRAFGLATETDTAQPITRASGSIPVGQALETDTAQPFSEIKIRALGQVVETDTAQAFAEQKVRALLQAVETDTAQPFSRLKTRTVGQALETDTAQPFGIGGNQTVAVGLAVETDTAFSITPLTAGGAVDRGSGGGPAYDQRGRYPARVQTIKSDEPARAKPSTPAVAQPAQTYDSPAVDLRDTLDALRALEQANPELEPAQVKRVADTLASLAVNAPDELAALARNEEEFVAFVIAMLL